LFNCGDHSSLDLVESISCACIHFDLEFDLLHGRDGMFVLEVKVQSSASKDSASRKCYTKGHVFKWDVGYGSMSLN